MCVQCFLYFSRLKIKFCLFFLCLSEKCVIFAKRYAVNSRPLAHGRAKGRQSACERPSFGAQKAANRKLPDVQALTRTALRLACTHAIAA